MRTDKTIVVFTSIFNRVHGLVGDSDQRPAIAAIVGIKCDLDQVIGGPGGDRAVRQIDQDNEKFIAANTRCRFRGPWP